MNEKELLIKAKADFAEFCAIFGGIPFADVARIARERGFDFGSACDDELVDINYKSILATCINDNGKSRVSPDVDFYDTEGGLWYRGDLEETIKRFVNNK